MAKNLQSKLSPSDRVSIFDINPQAMTGLETEMKARSTGAAVQLAASALDAAKDAVSLIDIYALRWSFAQEESFMMSTYCSIYDLSWGQLV